VVGGEADGGAAEVVVAVVGPADDAVGGVVVQRGAGYPAQAVVQRFAVDIAAVEAGVEGQRLAAQGVVVLIGV